MSSEKTDVFGPALPPGFKVPNSSSDITTDSSDDSNEPCEQENEDRKQKIIGPSLPPGFAFGEIENSQSLSAVSDDSLCLSICEADEVAASDNKLQCDENANKTNAIGPCLPPGFRHSVRGDTPDDHFYGPALPPGYQTSSSESRATAMPIIGPVLPPHLQNKEVHPAKRKGTFTGPALPPGCDKKYDDVTDSDEDEVVGPLPSEAASQDAQFDFTADFEKRSKRMKEHLLTQSQSRGNQELKRESWMTEMPDSFGHHLGLKSKGFSHSRAPKILKKEDKGQSEEVNKHLIAKNEDIGKQLDEYNKQKRPKSLLEIHRENRKKEKKEQGNKPEERRPFDRDSDLQIHRMDAKQTKSVLDRAKLVNSRFSHGASHYL